MEKELRRNEQEGMLGGVCAGLGEYLGLEKVWIRLFFVLSIFFSAIGIGLVGPIVYVILWVIVPKKPMVYPGFQSDFDKQANWKYNVGGDEILERRKEKKDSGKKSAGIVLLFIGFFLLIMQLDIISWYELLKFWPVIFILAGVSTIISSFKVKKKYAYANKKQEINDLSDEVD